MTTLTPAPPGPSPGNPGHFAHHNWLELSVKTLALPNLVVAYAGTQTTITTTTWANLGTDANITNPDPSKLLVCLCHFQWQATVGSGITVIAGLTADGATIIAEGTRGEEARAGQTTSTMTVNGTRVISVNPGTTRVRIGAKLTAAGSQAVSFPKLIVQPVGWA